MKLFISSSDRWTIGPYLERRKKWNQNECGCQVRFLSTGGNGVKANFGRSIIINLGGYFLGITIAVIGLLAHSLLVMRVGLVLIAIGAAAGGVMRVLAWASLGKSVPLYGAIAIGFRMAAAIGVLVAAIEIHF